ncbi:MAG: ABC transporter permease [Betaproteobacteria bacterium]|nr:ABC transporter permease [Betaproteobacteria bacterium]
MNLHLHATMRRVAAMVLRHTYLMRKSWIRIIETAYWPTMNMIMWGFIAQYFATTSSVIAQVPGMLVTALLLWEVLFRGQLGFALAFLEELYARNLGHLFVSPLRPYELVISMIVVSFIRTAIGVGAAIILAYVLYATSIFDLGFLLLAFFVNLLVTGWAVGLMVAALIMRYGLAAENLAWGLIFVAAPISGVYYPIGTLPEWLQHVAWALPTSHVFEGMRAVLTGGTFMWDGLLHAVWLNIVYMAMGIALFLLSFRAARIRGTLLQVGE